MNRHSMSMLFRTCASLLAALFVVGVLPSVALAERVFDVDYNTLNFTATGRTRISGSALSVGAVYRFPNVGSFTADGETSATQIRAEITIVAITNASLTEIDGSTNDARFEPEIETTSSSDGYVDFKVSFYDTSGNPVFLKNFFATGVDLDGLSSSVREFQEVGGFSSYQLDMSTGITVGTGSAGRVRFTGISSGISGIPFNNQCAYIASYTAQVSELTFRMGVTGNSGGNSRLFSIAFGSAGGTFSTPVAHNAPSVSIATTATNTSAPFTVSATFSESVTGFASNDIVVTGGTVMGSVSGSGASYTFVVEPTGTPSQITIYIVAGAALNTAMLATTASNILLVCGSGTYVNGGVCASCLDDSMTSTDSGCNSTTPYCVGSGSLAHCVECTSNTQCDDSNQCTTDSCTSNECGHVSVSAGTSCTGGVCDGALVDPECVLCVDNHADTTTDSGCGGLSPFCLINGSNRSCEQCIDDQTGATQDTGCNSTTPLCFDNGFGNFCVACVDDQSGATTDSGCNSGSPICEGSGASAECVPCQDDESVGDDLGCSGSTPACRADSTRGCFPCQDTTSSGVDQGCNSGSPNCVQTAPDAYECSACTMNSDCNDSNECTTDMCALGVCSHDSVASGDICTGGFCDGAAVAPICEVCLDDSSGTDTGCSGGTPNCVGASGSRMCVTCVMNAECSDGIECTTDTCSSGVCSNTPKSAGTDCTAGVCKSDAMCVECLMNSDCPTDERCDTSTNTCVDTCATNDDCHSPTPVCKTSSGMCVECLVNGDCPNGERCNTTTNMCSSACTTNADCASPTPVCDTGDGMCVECLAKSDCDSDEICTSKSCETLDHDGDGVDDITDIDDDNDGILDRIEFGGTDLSVDSDDDGIPDYRDADAVTCADANTDGVCDTLPESVDFDGDGIPNHFDLDSDGDHLSDIRESYALTDSNGDGMVDAFVDMDNNGYDDRLPADPEAPINTDGTDGPDFLDVDSDGDGVSDLIEAVDVNHDGVADRVSSGTDTNHDGLDDAFDGNDVPAEPDNDGDSMPDWRDVDDDNDGVLTINEDTNGNGDWADDDANDNGIPDYLDPARPVVPTMGGYSGGAGCGIGGNASAGGMLWVALAMLGVLARARRANRSAR